MAERARCLVVDLDGTLIRSDLFLEAVLRFVRRSPLNLFLMLLWTLQGREVAKNRVASAVDIDPAHLPFERKLLDYLRAERDGGARLILATGAPAVYAQAVAGHLELFDEVIVSSSRRSIKADSKLAAVRDHLGNEAFIYVGDSADDRVLWEAAAGGVFVNADKQASRFRSSGKVEGEVRSRPPVLRSLVAELRLHQWVKNLLVVLPLLASHSYLHGSAIAASALAFLCFCLCSSSVYFLNDLLDLHEDRQHPHKRGRPLASGDLPIRMGVAGCAVLAATAFSLSLALPWLFSAWLLAYFVASTAYSVFLKKIWAVDAITLAGLYTIRILAGAAAIAVAPSFWLLSFSLFAFLGLAYLKRFVEFAQAPETTYGRGYQASDSESMFSLGAASMTVSVLVLALFIRDAGTVDLYGTPELLWLLCLALLYWSNRLWFKARRGLIDDDPVVWTLQDPVSRLLAVAGVITVLAAKFLELT